MSSDEEKAKEYIQNILCRNYDNDGTSLYTEDEIEKAVLYGLAEGRKDRNCVNCSNNGKQFEVIKLEKQNKALGERVLQLQADKGKLIDKNRELKEQIKEYEEMLKYLQ